MKLKVVLFPSPNLGLSLKSSETSDEFVMGMLFPSPNLGLSLK